MHDWYLTLAKGLKQNIMYNIIARLSQKVQLELQRQYQLIISKTALLEGMA